MPSEAIEMQSTTPLKIHPSTAHLVQFFDFDHLPEKLKSVSRPFCELAAKVLLLPDNPEKTECLRKLLEAKDCAVRSVVAVVLAIFALTVTLTPTADAKILRSAKVSRDFTGTVTRVADGDTYIVKRSDGREVKVRLHWADCPEVAHNANETDQPGGKEAKADAEGLLLNHKVSVHVVGESYGRFVGDVVCDGTDAAQFLVEHGDAMVDPRYKPRPSLSAAQSKAKSDKTGIWKDSTPTPPWDWRSMNRGKQIESRK